MKRRALLGFGGLAIASLLAPLVARSLAPTERTYAVDLTGDSNLTLGAAPQRIRFRLRGTLRMTDAANQQIIGRLERPQVNLWQGSEEKTAESRVLETNLTAPFVLKKATDGTIATVAFSPESPEDSRQTLRALLTFFQASPQRPAKETDLAGTGEVVYQAQPGGKWEKQVLRYVAAPDTLTEQRPEGTQTVSFDPAGGVQEISGRRTLRTSLGDRELSVSTLSGTIRQTKRSPVLQQVALPTVGKAQPLNAGPDPGEQQRQRYAATLGEDTPATLLSALEQLPADARTSIANALYLKLRALLALQPESAAQFDAYLATANPDSAGMRALVDAIREIGSHQAQTALSKAIKARLSDPVFQELALPPLGLTARPTKDTEALLRELSLRPDSTGGQASLLLGTLANTLRVSEPPRSKALLHELITRLKANTEESVVLITLAALGNAGSPEALPELTPNLSHTSAARRSATVSALRLIPGTQTERLLLDLLRNDSESSVRANAAFALSFQPRSQVVRDALNKALSDSSKEVVDAAKRALASLPEETSSLKK